MQEAQITIARIQGAMEDEIVRIDVQDGAILLSRVEMSISDFARALLGLGRVPVAFTTKRELPQGRKS